MGGLAKLEYVRFVELIEVLSPLEWARPTECEPWDVRLLIAHVLGETEANASPREMLRQLRRGRRGLAVEVDTLSAVQVEQRRHLDPVSLLARMRAATPKAGALVALAGWSAVAGRAPAYETWRLRYLMDMIYTRGVWMHRIDVRRATGREVILTADHDGRIVSDVVAEWARRHGRPCLLTLEGPAGGRFVLGRGGPSIDIRCCRVLPDRVRAGQRDRPARDPGALLTGSAT